MAAKVGEERYVFETEWFDSQASLIRKYLFTYYPTDRTMEMVQPSFPLLTIPIVRFEEQEGFLKENTCSRSQLGRTLYWFNHHSLRKTAQDH